MKEGRERGKEDKTPTSLIEISELTHAACGTKNSLTARYNIAKKMSVSGGLYRSNLPVQRIVTCILATGIIVPPFRSQPPLTSLA